MPRMRTAPGVLKIIKEKDPDTEVTLNFLRVLIRTNKIRVTTFGRKKLVDADAVIEYLAAGTEASEPVTSGIRRVEERFT